MKKPVDLTRADTAPFEPTAIHRQLHAMAGTWQGEARTWLDPTAEPEVAPVHARVDVLLGGRYVQLEYASVVMGKPHAGRMLLGYDASEGRVTVAWIDSFHASPAMLISTGAPTGDGRLSVLGSYRGGDEDWGWRTELSMPSADEILVEEHNISPAGDEDRAVEMRLSRSRD